MLHINTSLFKPGMRVAVGLSGGADSVALLRALSARGAELGLVLHAAHMHHGLRGEEADADLDFARRLAAALGLPFHEARVDVAAEAQANPATGKSAETIEEAARRLRYQWFRRLISETPLDAIVTAHTLDDQAETVLAKFLRGAWTEGLSGIHPKLESPEGTILRPLLDTSRAEIEAYLRELGQGWREDSSNRHLTFTRNRIRHELLPLLEGWNPRLREHLAQMAALARDEEAWWAAGLARLAPQFLMQGRPVRGGGRAAAGDGLAPILSPTLSIDVTRLAALPPAVQRRLLRYAAVHLSAAPDFAATESLRTLALAGRAGQKLELAQGLRAERTHRELRLTAGPISETGKPGAGKPGAGQDLAAPPPEYKGTIPGEIDAPAFGLRLRIDLCAASPNPAPSAPDASSPVSPGEGQGTSCERPATLRNWRPGDRVILRYSNGLRKVKKVLERMRVTGTSRMLWPVLELDGRIVWMRGVELRPDPGIAIEARFADGFTDASASHTTPQRNYRHG
jgi:tRNA(Ile)-lysidine synthase